MTIAYLSALRVNKKLLLHIENKVRAAKIKFPAPTFLFGFLMVRSPYICLGFKAPRSWSDLHSLFSSEIKGWKASAFT